MIVYLKKLLEYLKKSSKKEYNGAKREHIILSLESAIEILEDLRKENINGK